jgi:hypothetical protein
LARIRRRWPKASGIWRLEFKERESGAHLGEVAPHFHLLLWEVPLTWTDEEEKQLHWRFVFAGQKGLELRNGKRLLKREEYQEGKLVGSSRGVFANSGEGEVRVHRRATRRRGKGGRMIEGEIVEWWEMRPGERDLDEEVEHCSEGVGAGRVELKEWVALAWWMIVGSEQREHLAAGTRVEQVRSTAGVMWYASKYCAKVDEGLEMETGRVWGVLNHECLPWSESLRFELTQRGEVVLRRTARRYVRSQQRAARARDIERGRPGRARRRWCPGGSCVWFTKPRAWVRFIESLVEPEDPWRTDELSAGLDRGPAWMAKQRERERKQHEEQWQTAAGRSAAAVNGSERSAAAVEAASDKFHKAWLHHLVSVDAPEGMWWQGR